jgi:hypothetical protein
MQIQLTRNRSKPRDSQPPVELSEEAKRIVRLLEQGKYAEVTPMRLLDHHGKPAPPDSR